MAANNYPIDHGQCTWISGNIEKDGTGDEHRIVVNASGQLVVEITGTSTISGTVTVQDGGGTITIDNADITAIKNAVQIMDDWDESDYCKNILYGHDGAAYRRAKINASGELSVYTP